MRFGMAPEKLAARALRAVKRNRMRQRIGFDAYLADWMKRLLPVAIHTPLRWAFARAARARAQTGSGAAGPGPTPTPPAASPRTGAASP
jgi:hypothetical protein